jgi:4-hydroxy-tetrahydrodipicolinate reductase
MKFVVAGAAGRMGRVLVRVIGETPGCEVTGGIEAANSPHLGHDLGELAGLGSLGIKLTADAGKALVGADGVVDFTIPVASLALCELTGARGLIHVIGTTGIDRAGEARIEDAAKRARIVKSGNFSFGVNLLAGLVSKAAALLGAEFDIEVVEMHHRAKIDAPSGTALLLGQAAADGRGIKLAENSIRGRDGHTGPRREGHIGFASLRGGSVVGDHTVIFAGPQERIELTHRAESREMFARGAVWAALKVRERAPGLYSMPDLMAME